MNDTGLKILFIFTGGTIGTAVSEDGKRRIEEHGEGKMPLPLRIIRERLPEPDFTADIREPYLVLSEHMTLSHLEKLAACLREEELTASNTSPSCSAPRGREESIRATSRDDTKPLRSVSESGRAWSICSQESRKAKVRNNKICLITKNFLQRDR